MPKHTAPEIQRTSLTSVISLSTAIPDIQVVLTLKSLGIDDVLTFPYLDPPEERMLLEVSML